MIINFTATDTNASINKLNQSINNFINLSETPGRPQVVN